MSEEITIKIPKKLAEFIDDLTKQGYFESRDDFAKRSIEIMSELYGLAKTAKGGKSLLDVLIDNSKVSKSKDSMKKSPTKQTEEQQRPARTSASAEALTNEEYDILDMFTGSTFEYEDALHARYTMELMKLAKAPLPKKEFIEKLEGLEKKKKLEKKEYRKKIVWKLIDKY